MANRLIEPQIVPFEPQNDRPESRFKDSPPQIAQEEPQVTLAEPRGA